MLVNGQPANNPGIAAGVNIGKIVSASEIRTCTAPNEIGAKISVRAIYNAAMTAPCVKYIMDFL